MKLFLKIVLSILILFILVSGSGIFFLTRGLETGSKLEINDVNLLALDDGAYDGKYKAGRWTNEVSVTVRDHKITKIDIVKDVLFPKPEWSEALINKVIEKQSNNVDGVSGATVTSKAYLKSVENALRR